MGFWNDIKTTNPAYFPLLGTAVVLTAGGGAGGLAYAVVTNGVITSVNVILGGTGYANSFAVTFTGVGTGATATGTAVAGVITSIAVGAGGTGYTGTSPAWKLNYSGNVWDLLIDSIATLRDNVNGNQKTINNLASVTSGVMMIDAAAPLDKQVKFAIGGASSYELYQVYQAANADYLMIYDRINSREMVRFDRVGTAGTVTFTAARRDVSQAVILANGANQNVAILGKTYIRVSGPSGAFSVGGFAGGLDGYALTVWNASGQAMTINNQDAGSTAGNRISTNTGANVTLRAGNSSATFIYDGPNAQWVLLSTN